MRKQAARLAAGSSQPLGRGEDSTIGGIPALAEIGFKAAFGEPPMTLARDPDVSSDASGRGWRR